MAYAPDIDWWQCLFFHGKITATGKLWLWMFNNAYDKRELRLDALIKED